MRSEHPPPLPPELAHAQVAPHVPHADRSGPHRFRRAIGVLASLVGTVITFMATLAGGTVIHMGVAPARRIASAAVNQILDGSFRGKMAITRLGSLRPYQVDGVSATLSTHEGQPILSAEGIHARIAIGPLLWSLVKGGEMKIEITDLSIDHIDALLAQGQDGQLTVAEAFQPAVEGPPPPPPKKSTGGLDLGLPKVVLRTAWVHGAMGGTPVDATIEKLTASFCMTLKTMGARGAFGAEVRALTKDAPISLDVKGKLDSSLIDAQVKALTGTSRVDLTAHARIPSDQDPTTSAYVKIAARDVNATAFGGPESSLGLDTEASADVAANGGVIGRYEVHVLPGVVSAEPIPDARIRGTFTDKRVLGSANVAETGAPVELRYDVALAAADGPDIGFDLTTRSHDLTKIPQLRGVLKGTALIEAKGHASLGSKKIDGHVVTQLENFSVGSIAFDHATADATVRGSLLSPQSALLLNVSDLRIASLLFPVVSMSAYGSPKDMRIDAKLDGEGDRHLLLGANVAVADGVRVRDVALNLRRANDSVTAKVALVTSRDGRLDVEGVTIDGAGAPLTAEAHVRPGTIAAKVSTAGLDLATIARFVEGEKSKRAGRIALDVDVTASRTATRGHANINASGVTDGQYLNAFNATIATTFQGRTLDAKIDAGDVKMGHVLVTTEGVRLDGGVLEPAAFRDATGNVHAEVDVDLGKATQASPVDLPIQEASGRIVAKVEGSRDDARKRPSIAVDVATDKLSFSALPATVPNDDGSVTVVKKPFHSQDIDAHVVASVDGSTGDAKLDVQLRDKAGPLLQANAAAKLPVERLFAGDAQEALLATTATFHAEVPMRSLDSLPPMLGTLPIRGNVAFTLDVKGDAHSPQITSELKAQHIIDSDDPTPIPIDVDTKFSYDGKHAVVAFTANRPKGQVLDGQADMAIAIADLLDGKSPPPWEANADIKLHEMPIGALADFANQEIDGNISGEIALHDLHKAGALNAELTLDNLVLSGAKFPRATVSLDVWDGKLAADARIEQTDGFAEITVGGAMKWGDEVAPSPDGSKPAQVKLAAKNFRLIAFAPFLQGALDELDGIVNADATLRVKPGFKDGTLDGTIAIDKGLVESPVVGEEFHDLKAQITMDPWGTWNVKELSGRATSGRFTATAQAKLDGFHLDSAEAHLKIDERDKIPLTMQGTALGQAWGNVDVKGAMSKDGKQLNLDVSVPKLHVDLEDATGHSVESTDLDPTITVGMHDKHGTMERLPFDGSQAMKPPPPKNPPPDAPPPIAIHVVTHLGPDLEVRRGTMLKVYVTGGPTIDTGVTTKLSGDIRIPNGYVELQGKRFQIENSKVTFTGQPVDNPLVDASASYVAPDADQTKVTARFIGPVKTGKVALESEPNLTDAQIFSLLMFGTSDGTFGQSAPPGQAGNDTTQAASVAGGVVTEALNKAISGVTGGLDVQTSVDTQQTGNPRPEVEVALSRRVSATVMYSLGVPPPGDNPDDTLLRIDWRFHGHYSTETTLGDKGTTIVDLAWKYRY
jgi:translocation and assembly module TamB